MTKNLIKKLTHCSPNVYVKRPFKILSRSYTIKSCVRLNFYRIRPNKLHYKHLVRCRKILKVLLRHFCKKIVRSYAMKIFRCQGKLASILAANSLNLRAAIPIPITAISLSVHQNSLPLPCTLFLAKKHTVRN